MKKIKMKNGKLQSKTKNSFDSFKIGIDARMYGSRQTGIGIYVKNLIKQLAQLDKTNEYFVFLLPQNFNLLKNLPINFHKIKVNSYWYSLREQTVFLKDILRYKLDLMHFTHFNLPILYPRKFIVTIHDITPKFFPGQKMGKSWYRREAYDLIITSATKRAKKIIVPSCKTKADLVKYYKANKDKIKIVYEGINYKKSFDERKAFLENYSQNKEIARKKILSKFNLKLPIAPYIFYTGVWREHKNLPKLIEAFDVLLKNYSFRGFLILGGSEDLDYPETRQEWQSRGLEGKILRPGFISDENLTYFYQAADIFILPSLYEGFGLVCLESLNHGTPVACSDIDPLREILGDAALYFNPRNPYDMANKIWKILESKKLQMTLLEKSQPILEKYSWPKMTWETLNLYKETLKEN